MVHSYHIPSIPIAVLSPGRTVLRHPKRFDAHTVYTNHVMGNGYAQFHGIIGNTYTHIPGIIRGVLVYAQAVCPALTLYGGGGGIMHLEEEHGVIYLCHISVSAERILWDQRMGRINFRKLSEIHKHVDGVPKISIPSDVNKCMT
jgi:hypothetical protein